VRLSIGAKLFFLVVASFIFVALLAIFRSENFFKICSNGEQFVKINVQNIKNIDVLCYKSGTNVSLCNTLNGRWTCNFDGIEIPANQHAITELLSVLESLKFCINECGDFDNINFDWEVSLTDNLGNTSKLKITKTNVYFKTKGVTFSIENGGIEKRLAKIYPELYCKKLFDGIDAVLRLKFSAKDFSLTFVKSGDFFKMTVPIGRPANEKFTDILRDVFSLHCSAVSKARGSQHPPLFTLELDRGKARELVEFYGKNSKFCAKIAGTVYNFDEKMSNIVHSLYSKLANFQIFSGLQCTSIDIFSLPDNRQISLKKLENSEKWQKLCRSNGSMIFADAANDKIHSIEDKIADFGPPIRFDAKVRAPYVGKLSLKSNIGEFNFDILKNSDEYVFLNCESSLAFAADKEFVGVLYSLLDDVH
jgi:hypothetical protein